MTSIQDDVNVLTNWVADNRLALNAVKIKFMFLSCSRSFNFSPLLLNGSKLDSHFKHLGVWMSLLKHIENICSKSCRTLGCIFRTFSPYCDPEAILSFYKSQVLPVLEYTCVVLGSSQKDQLFKSVQLFATRLSSQNWSANSDTLNYFKLLFTYKFVYGDLYCPPVFFCNVTQITLHAAMG